MECPVCKQGNIYNAKIIRSEIFLKICDECEACWKRDEVICIEKFYGLVLVLEEHGFEYKSGVLEDLGYLIINKVSCHIVSIRDRVFNE